MSEFKGTKGKWIIDTDESYLNDYGVLATPISIENFMIGFIDVYGDQKEDKANALLISKAPKMLEMLELLYSDLKQGALPNENELKSLGDLIKEATEF